MKNMKWKKAQEVIKKGTTFLEFYTDWCGDCKMMDPTVANVEVVLNDELNKDIRFIKVNAEEANLFKNDSSDIEVLKIPSFFKVVDGKYEHIGYEYLPIDTLTKPFK